MFAPRNAKHASLGSPELRCFRNPKATFFVLGWIAKRRPHLIREIHARGHEVASHGYYHTLCKQQTPDNLKKDLSDTKKLLEDILAAPVFGYRAPSFSISDDILKIVANCGYLYDSSYNSFAIHGRYGQMDLSQNGKRGIALEIPKTQHPAPKSQDPASSTLFELPISNLNVKNLFSYRLSANSNQQNRGTLVLPWGGGGYFRLLPTLFFKMGVKAILKKQGAYLFYLHPWEIDPQQPQVPDVPKSFRLRHYTNLDKTEAKLFSFIAAFRHCTFTNCYDYLRLQELLCPKA
ncbi:MAG: polysaccharide deacetylase family protein [Thermodesulfobacteriota bacterium]|nr:polysaccharide deacetylase family protein [Thermodesulfobacteriota bacterium]